MLKIVQTILTVARIETQTMVLHRENFKLRVLINEILDLYYFVLYEKNIKSELNCPDYIEMFADHSLIKQALANILDNAIKYSESNSKISFFVQKSSH